MDWTDFFSGLTGLGSSIAGAVIGPTVPTILPGNAGVYLPPGASGGQVVQSSALGSSTNLILILGLAAIVFLFALRK
jgi:hypothetical protein